MFNNLTRRVQLIFLFGKDETVDEGPMCIDDLTRDFINTRYMMIEDSGFCKTL